MKQLLLIAASLVLLSSCAKQRTCTCSTAGQPGHVILGYSMKECSDYEALVKERVCSFDE